MKDIWKDIEGFEGFYQVSNTGEVKSCDRVASRTIKRPDVPEYTDTYPVKGKILKQSINGSGYPQVMFSVNGKRDNIHVHRVVAMAFIPNPQNYKEVNHIDGNKANNRIENLEWCSRSGNAIHAYEKGLIKPRPGSSSPVSKLKEEDILEIRSLYSKGQLLQREIADAYDVSISCINGIINNRRWNHV